MRIGSLAGRAAWVLACASMIIIPRSAALAQGSLTPPGAPAPTFKTLDEVRPGTPISSLPFSITNPGVYFVSKPLTSTSGGITINSSDVSLDLMGFTLDGGGSSSSGVEINHVNRAVVRNGTVRNFSLAGVYVVSPATNALIEDITLQGCTNGAGIELDGTASTVQRCRAYQNKVGIYVLGGHNHVIDSCQAVGNTQNGFLITGTNNLVIRNLAANAPSSDYGIYQSNYVGAVVLPAPTLTVTNNGGPGSGTTDPFANLRY